MGAFYIQEEQKFKYALHQQRINFLTYFVTHLLVSFIPVEPRLSLDLLELGLSSVSFFETSFLNGSFLALKTAMVKYKWHMPNIFLWIIDQSKFKNKKTNDLPVQHISAVHEALYSQGGRHTVSPLYWKTLSPNHNTLNQDCEHLWPP